MEIFMFQTVTITETGSVRGSVEASKIEINGHIQGKITADAIVIGRKCGNQRAMFILKIH